MDPLSHRDERIIKKTMDFTGTNSEEGEDHKIGRKGEAIIFWDARSIIYIDYLPSKQTINDNYYVALLDRFNNISKKKRSHLTKKKVLFHQDNVLGTDGQIQRIPLRIASPSSIFVRFSPLRLFSVSKPKEMVRKEIHQRAIHRRNKGLF